MSDSPFGTLLQIIEFILTFYSRYHQSLQTYLKVVKEKILGLGVGHIAIAWQYPGQALEVIPANSSRMTRPTLSRPQL
jgi:hypothetical protein